MKIVFAGNCQAYALYWIYERHIGASLGQTVGWVDAWNEHRLDDWKAELAGADILVSQVFTSPPRVPVDEIAGDVRTIRFPDVRGGFLWPYGNVSRPNNPQPPYKGGGPYDTEVGDAFLNRLIEAQTPADEALARYLDVDIAHTAHLDRVFELTLDQQRRRDATAGIAMADYIESRFRTERLFNTQGHLSVSLFHHLAEEVYGRIGADDVMIDEVRRNVRGSPFEPFHDAPVHPGVIDHYKLAYLDASSGYHHVQEGRFTFAERVRRYMDNAWSPKLHEGLALADKGETARAIDLIAEGLALAPRSAHGFSRMGELLARVGRYDEGVEATRRGHELEPEDEAIASRFEWARSVGAGA